MRVKLVPRRIARPKDRRSPVVSPFAGLCNSSSTSSMTRFINWSYPLSTPITACELQLRTFTSAGKFHANFLIHVLGQVQDGLFFRLFLGRISTTPRCIATYASSASASATTSLILWCQCGNNAPDPTWLSSWVVAWLAGKEQVLTNNHVFAVYHWCTVYYAAGAHPDPARRDSL